MSNELNKSSMPIDPGKMRLAAAGGAVAIAAGSVAVAAMDPINDGTLPACPLLSMTGYACPGCGMTRGLHSLFHGNFIDAIDFNLLIPFWVMLGAYIFVSLSVYAIRGRGLPAFYLNVGAIYGALGVLLIFGVVRNIPTWPFTILFP